VCLCTVKISTGHAHTHTRQQNKPPTRFVVPCVCVCSCVPIATNKPGESREREGAESAIIGYKRQSHQTPDVQIKTK